MRSSTLFAGFIGCCLLLGLACALQATARQRSDAGQLLGRRQLVKQLRLTDLCLFTDARYTRNPSQADLHSPFQDYPLAFEHFPSGALLPPPPQLRSHGLD
jgi:hypothetical protein